MSSTDMILSQNCFLQVQRGITKENTYSRVMVVVLCTSSYDAYGNTCMKFYEHILNGFKVVEQTWFCYGTAKLQRDVTQKIHIQELWFLHSACHLLVLNIGMKFYEYILISSKDIERTRFCQETATKKVQRDVTQKVSTQRAMVLALCMSPNVG